MKSTIITILGIILVTNLAADHFLHIGLLGFTNCILLLVILHLLVGQKLLLWIDSWISDEETIA